MHQRHQKEVHELGWGKSRHGRIGSQSEGSQILESGSGGAWNLIGIRVSTSATSPPETMPQRLIARLRAQTRAAQEMQEASKRETVHWNSPRRANDLLVSAASIQKSMEGFDTMYLLLRQWSAWTGFSRNGIGPYLHQVVDCHGLDWRSHIDLASANSGDADRQARSCVGSGLRLRFGTNVVGRSSSRSNSKKAGGGS